MDIFILRIWLQFIRADYYHPFTQGILKVTKPVTAPFNKMNLSVKNIDLVSLIIVFILAIIKVTILMYFIFNQWTFNLIYLYYAVLTVLYTFGYLIFWVLVIQAVLSWIAQNSPMFSILQQLTEPLVRPIRRIIPPIGMIDISFMVFLLIMYFIDYLCYTFLGSAWVIASN